MHFCVYDRTTYSIFYWYLLKYWHPWLCMGQLFTCGFMRCVFVLLTHLSQRFPRPVLSGVTHLTHPAHSDDLLRAALRLALSHTPQGAWEERRSVLPACLCFIELGMNSLSDREIAFTHVICYETWDQGLCARPPNRIRSSSLQSLTKRQKSSGVCFTLTGSIN